jgi:hypothetical protein
LKVIAVPRPGFEPGDEILGMATLVLPDLLRLQPSLIRQVLANVD